MGRPSVYLERKCECLKNVLDFFLSSDGGFCRSVKDKRTVFLAQIDFWDWEMDELCYSIDSFLERSKAWESAQTTKECVAKLALPLKQSVLKELAWRRVTTNNVTPPINSLNQVIDKWNMLLTKCEETLLMTGKDLDKALKFGAQFEKDLSKYRKKVRCEVS